MPWSNSFHESFSVVPTGKPTDAQVNLFLSSHGKSERDVLAAWPKGRPNMITAGQPLKPANPKQFRNMSQLLRNIGLAYTDTSGNDGVVCVTRLGQEVLEWRQDGLNGSNVRIIARYASRAIAAAQLQNPTREAKGYNGTRVFPFQFIWRAMLSLDNRISIPELERAMFVVNNEADLGEAILKIRHFRETGNLNDLGPTNANGDDEGVAAWMCWASFGWSLIPKRKAGGDGYYRIPHGWPLQIIREAATTRQRHRTFSTDREYVEHLSACAGLPPDLR